VTSALKRLVGFVSSKAAGCSYCQAHHPGGGALRRRSGEAGERLGVSHTSRLHRSGAGCARLRTRRIDDPECSRCRSAEPSAPALG
jgi:alkylhydroperoxidase family enzyme